MRDMFEAHGWLILRAVVSHRDLAELNRVFDSLMTPDAAPSREDRRGAIHRPGACRSSAVMLRHLHEGLAAIACELLGARSVQLLQDALLLKQPSAGGSIALHQDYSYTGYLDSPASLSMGLALTDATRDDGCLTVVDGSHTWGLIGGLHLFAGELENDLGSRLSPAQRERVERATIPLEVRAGDVTVHHCLTLHGSGNNTSDRPRKTIITHLFSGDCTLVRERLPVDVRHRFTTDDRGHLTAPAFPTLHRTTDHDGSSAEIR